MPSYQVSRTLVKSAPELWAELNGARLREAITGARVRPTEAEKAIAWEAAGARGTARLEPSGWGTKVTLTAEVDEPGGLEQGVAGLEDEVARVGFWTRLRRRHSPPPEPRPAPSDMGRCLERLLDDLGSAHRKPFARE
jgi:hypothetical protein